MLRVYTHLLICFHLMHVVAPVEASSESFLSRFTGKRKLVAHACGYAANMCCGGGGTTYSDCYRCTAQCGSVPGACDEALSDCTGPVDCTTTLAGVGGFDVTVTHYKGSGTHVLTSGWAAAFTHSSATTCPMQSCALTHVSGTDMSACITNPGSALGAYSLDTSSCTAFGTAEMQLACTVGGVAFPTAANSITVTLNDICGLPNTLTA